MKLLLSSILVLSASTALAIGGGNVVSSAFAHWDSQSQYDYALQAVAEYASEEACMTNITIEKNGERLLVSDVDSGNQMLVNVYVNFFQTDKGWQVKKTGGQTSCD